MATIQETTPVSAQVQSPRPTAGPRPEPGSRTLLVIGPEMTRKIADLSARTGYDTGELVDIALAIFEMSLDAVEEGKRVGVVDDEQVLDNEFWGFHKDDPTL